MVNVSDLGKFCFPPILKPRIHGRFTVSHVQDGAKSLQSLIGENEILLWDSDSGSSRAVEGLSVEQTEGSRNESVLLFKLDATIWTPPAYDREVRVFIKRKGLAPQYPFLRKCRTVQQEGFFFLQVRVCTGSGLVEVMAKLPHDPKLVMRDARRVQSRAYNVRRQRGSYAIS